MDKTCKWVVHVELTVGILPWTWLGDYDSESAAKDRATEAMKADFTWAYTGEFGDEIVIGRALRCRISKETCWITED